MSMNGVHCGLRLPDSIDATSVARWPTVRPAASITYHFRLPASSFPLGKYVDIVNYLCFQRVKRERLEYLCVEKVVKQRGFEVMSQFEGISLRSSAHSALKGCFQRRDAEDSQRSQRN